MTDYTEVIKHYDLLIDENNDPVHDPKPLRDYMDKWDGEGFIDRLSLDKSKSVLEIGVGTGRLALRTASLCSRFSGIDISVKTIARAKENLSAQTNAEFYCGDFLAFEFIETFDVIYSSLTFMHIEDKRKAIKKVATLLNNGGLFVLSTDKNQDCYIDLGTRRLKVYPDVPEDIKDFISDAGLTLIEHYETEFANIFVSKKV